MPIEHIWRYYQAVAEEIGKETDSQGKPLAFNYVITHFFDPDADPNEQNDLVRAFLGDTEIHLTWNIDNMTLNDIEPYLSNKAVPYSAQKTAVLNALNKPISIVQGPPGTGKTETILNLLSAIHGLYPEKTVAVVSTNNEAVNNIYDKIKKCHEEGSADFDPIIGRLYDCFAVLGNSSVRKKWKETMEERDIDTADLYTGNKFSPQLLETFPLFSSTIHSLRSNFTNEVGFDGQFDFVIMDEASQTNIMLGIIAMSCAKQMVVIGDDKQLSPIIKDSAIEVGRLFGDDINLYKEENGKSFLSLCGRVFAPDITSVFLNEHFRCHPSIISFCNQYVYEDRLILRKKGDGFKIRAVWYEGDYCEKITQKVEDKSNSKIYNMRQIKIFTEEEIPRLSALMRQNPDLSVMIIAPFREQIARLKEALKQLEIAYEEAKSSDEEEAEELLNYNNIFCLTIHKSQGKGYDLVYLLTTEDYSTSDEPWCQRMRLMNVAVSRAKKEFCVITASQWLPEEFQQRFTGYTLPDNICNLEDGDSMYFYKLMNYIGCNCPQPQGDYGFHKSYIASVFDKVPYFRMKYNTGRNCSGANSAPARCVKEMLEEIIEDLPQKQDYSILTEVPLKDFQLEGQAVSCDDQPLLQYGENAKCDFAVCKGKQVRLILEVDGSFHRSDEYRKSCDELKDKWINELLKGGSLYLRLTTDGSSSGERNKLTDLITNSENSEITITSKRIKIAANENLRQTAVQVLKQKTWEAFEELRKSIKLAVNPQHRDFNSLSQILIDPNNLDRLVDLPIFQALAMGNNYYAPKGVSYDKKITSDFYLCRYASAYAFEYAMMYDIVMRSFIKNGGHGMLGVFSFGCGTMLDALSMVYAKARLGKYEDCYKRCKLYYKGIDRTEWDRTYVYQTLAQNGTNKADDLIHSQFEKICFYRMEINTFLQKKFIEKNSKSVYHNVLFFPKILNEMKQIAIDGLVDKLAQLNFNLDEYYICASHSFSDVQYYGGADIVTRIVDTINRNNQFEVCGDIWEMMGIEEIESFEKTWLGKKEKQGKIDDLIDITQNNEDLNDLTRGKNLWDIMSEKHSAKPSFPCYCFKSNVQYKIKNHRQEKCDFPQCINDLNGDFSVNSAINKFFSKALDNVLDETCKHLKMNKAKNTCPISRVSQITFQIIRLKRR